MKTRLFSLAFLSLLTVALPSRAADNPALPYPSPSVTIRPTEYANINVDFPGGALVQLMSQLSKIDGVSLNIMGTEYDFKKAELPAFSLRNVNLITLTEVLRSFLQPIGYDLQSMGGNANPNTMALMLRRVGVPKPPKPLPSEFKSFRLSPYLQAQSVDDIVGAIRAGWELDPAHDPKALNLKYHPGTSILLVSGPNEAIRLTEDIFRQLRYSPEVPPKLEPKTPFVPEPAKK